MNEQFMNSTKLIEVLFKSYECSTKSYRNGERLNATRLYRRLSSKTTRILSKNTKTQHKVMKSRTTFM